MYLANAPSPSHILVTQRPSGENDFWPPKGALLCLRYLRYLTMADELGR